VVRSRFVLKKVVRMYVVKSCATRQRHSNARISR
jgi:hypothetical protein